jgi:hypothetical protein
MYIAHDVACIDLDAGEATLRYFLARSERLSNGLSQVVPQRNARGVTTKASSEIFTKNQG